MPIAIMLSVQYRVAEGVAASSVFLSVIGSVVTVGLFIVIAVLKVG
jgi:predicted permease